MRPWRRALDTFLCDWLLPAGLLYVYVPPADPHATPEPAGPAPGHPERRCPEVPLSASERAWERQLAGDA
ncbi:DUF6059 family protein [Streptomyces sp. NPDC087440]|uniref:DUF6059 family protein n=1 Tax=Streptomyces sp. NPDC087440 TaxID=3365790 RepID=UPI003829B2E5